MLSGRWERGAYALVDGSEPPFDGAARAPNRMLEQVGEPHERREASRVGRRADPLVNFALRLASKVQIGVALPADGPGVVEPPLQTRQRIRDECGEDQ